MAGWQPEDPKDPRRRGWVVLGVSIVVAAILFLAAAVLTWKSVFGDPQFVGCIDSLCAEDALYVLSRIAIAGSAIVLIGGPILAWVIRRRR